MNTLVTTTQLLYTLSTDNSTIIYRCLFGLSSLKICGYNPLNPTVYFSLGDALAAAGLLLAVWQLKKKSWDIVLKIRPWWQRNLNWILIITGFLCTLIAAVLPQIPIIARSWLNYPLTYEIIGSILIGFSPVVLIFFARPNKKLFNEKNADRFDQTIQLETARSTDETMPAIVDVVFLNLQTIIQFLKNQHPRQPDTTRPPDAADYANNVMIIIFTNKKFVDYICTKRLDFLLTFLQIIKKEKAFTYTHLPFHAISRCLFGNGSSYLYTQYDSENLLSDLSIYGNLFYDQEMLGMNPLKDWVRSRKDETSDYLDEQFIEVYIKSFKNAIDGYFFSQILTAKNVIIWALGEIVSSSPSSYCQSLLYKFRDRAIQGIVSSRLLTVEYFLGNTLFYIFNEAYNNKKIIDADFINAKKDDAHRNLVVAYAESIYNYFVILSQLHDQESIPTQFRAASLTINLFITHNENNLSKKLTELFTEFLWDKINQNLERGVPSAVLKLYIGMVGFKTSENPNNLFNKERNRVIKFMYEELATKIIAGNITVNNEKIEKAFLPNEVTFNRETRKFEYNTPTNVQVMEAVTDPAAPDNERVV